MLVLTRQSGYYSLHMSALIIERSTLELPVLDTPTEGLARPLQEFVLYCSMTLADSSAHLIQEDELHEEATADHHIIEELSLQAVRTYDKVKKNSRRKKVVGNLALKASTSKLGILDADGAMQYSLCHKKMAKIKLQEDPFLEHILERFRTHYGTVVL